MMAVGSYQRRTGPTYEYHGSLEVAGRTLPYALPRSEETVRPVRVALPSPGAGTGGRVMVRRYPTEDPFTPLELREEADGGTELVAYLPPQPPAGKLEYWIELSTRGGDVRIPEGGAGERGTIVIRFKGPVPLPLLLSHVFLMFVSMMVGVRAALGAGAGEPRAVALAWWTLGGLTAGGMILGPFVQEYAFGAFWTGFPWGYDLTDNKTLLMWLSWAAACGVLAARRQRRGAGPGRAERVAILAAAAVMLVVYLIPHSLRGSELDYAQVDEGVQASEAVRSGG